MYRRVGQRERALADLDRALAIQPDFFAGRFNRGTLFAEMERYAQALEDLDVCIRLDPHAAPPYFNRAVARHEVGETAAATADLERFLDLSQSERWTQLARELLRDWAHSREIPDP